MNASNKATTKNKTESIAVTWLILFSNPLCFLFANNSDFSPENADVASSLEFCKTITTINNNEITNKI